MLWNVCNQTNWWARCHGQGDTWPGSYKSTWDGKTGSFCHSAKRSMCVCPIYRCLSLCSKIKPCQSLNQSLIRGVIQANSSLVLCVVCLGAKHAQLALEWAGCSHCERLSLRTHRSRRAFFEEGSSPQRSSWLWLSMANTAITVVGFTGGCRGGNRDGRVPFSFLCCGTVWGACGGYNSCGGQVTSWMAHWEAGWTLKKQIRWAFFEV